MVATEADTSVAPPRFRFVVPGVGMVGGQPVPRHVQQQPQRLVESRANVAHDASVGLAPPRTPSGHAGPSAYRRDVHGGVVAPRQAARYGHAIRLQVTPTEEQQGVIDDESTVVVAVALAGSGKTTASIAFTLARPHEKALYVCFAKANADEAAGRFPRHHVECRTGHALAYARLDARTRARVPKFWNARTITEDVLGLTGSKLSWNDVSIVQRMFKDFFADTAPEIDAQVHSVSARAADPRVSEAKLQICAEKANALWQDMCNLAGRCRIPHDGYLKRFILARPNLGFDRLIFEEAQDGNPLMAALVRQQLEYGAKLLIIGDPHQSIYKFRGAYNIFQDLPAGASVHALTNTWRFGPATAEKVNLLLAAFKPDEPARVVGCGQDRSWDDSATTTYLARTNAKLFEMAVAHVESKETPIYWVGGIAKYRVHMLLDAYALWEGRTNDARDEFFRGIYSWDELRKYAESTNDPDARILHALVEQYKHRIPDLVERINAQVSETIDRAGIGLGTGHSAKGLEFPQVQLCDDFDKSFERALTAYQSDEVTPEDEQEINLLYVALSRAKYCVQPNPGLQSWMEEERFRQQEAAAQHLHSHSMTMADRP
ncbi:MAG: ATP-dependent helicase [Achromobacter sp.]|nr:ATP-dependent helicase [Achromobacter sp.]